MKTTAHLSSLLLLLLTLGCSGSDAPEVSSNIIHVGNRSEVQDLDPHLVSGIAEHRALSALFDGLADLDLATMEPIPAAAESWTVSEDGKRYTFTMRKDAKWSNGEPVIAQDFAWSWQRMLSPALGAEYSYLLHCIENAKAFNDGDVTDFAEVGVKAVDDYTLEVVLAAPTPYFLSMQTHFAWYPVHRATIEQFGAMTDRGTGWTRTGNHVSNGPFKLGAWHPDEVLETVRNEHYWDAANVKLDGVNFYPISNEQTEERSFRSGDLHLTYSIPMYKIEEYRRDQPEVLQVHPYLQTYFYRFNTSAPPFDDVRVRQAFGMAVDREAIARDVLKAGERPAYAYTPPNTAGYTSTYQVRTDIEAAKALLAEAGYPGSEGFPAVDLLYNTSETDKIIAETVQQMWKKHLGVDVRLFNQDYKVYLSTMKTLDYNIARSTWLGDVLDPVNFLECFLAGEGNNRTGYASDEFDAAIHAAYAEPDPQKRIAHLQKAEARLLEDAPITPVYYQTQKFLMSPRVQGMIPNPLGNFRWQDISLAPDGP